MENKLIFNYRQELMSVNQSFINTGKLTHLHEPELSILLYNYYYNINFIQLTQNNKICIITIIINIVVVFHTWAYRRLRCKWVVAYYELACRMILESDLTGRSETPSIFWVTGSTRPGSHLSACCSTSAVDSCWFSSILKPPAPTSCHTTPVQSNLQCQHIYMIWGSM